MKKSKLLGLAGAMVLAFTSYGIAALLDVTPGLPLTRFNPSTIPLPFSYNAGTGLVSATGIPFSTTFAAPIGSRIVSGATRSLALQFLLDSTGTVVSGVAGDDLVLTGSIDTSDPADGVPDFTGVLLTGEVVAFGHVASTSPTSKIDFFDLRAVVTGGQLATLYTGQEIGVTGTLENSTFTSFSQSFTAKMKGSLGPIPSRRICTGAIGDFVWHDKDRNGIQDSGEPGINGVTVILKDSANNVLDTDVTHNGPMGQAGYYQFEKLCAGAYTVDLDLTTVPAGYTPTDSNVGGDDTVDSDARPVTVTLAGDGSTDQTIDFGFETACAGAIGDFVWNDINRDGIQDPSEPGIPQVTVTLEDETGAVLSTTTTNASGFYEFPGLCPGKYRVRVDETTLPPVFVPTLTDQGSDDAKDSDANPTLVTLGNDEINHTIDFGYTACAGVIGDFLWHDLNRNGIQEPGEPGLNGINLTLKDDLGVVIASTQTMTKPSTSSDGFYQFAGVCTGIYSVHVDASTVPAGFLASPTELGGNTAFDSNVQPALVVLPNDFGEDLTIDFGFNIPCSGRIGDFVWEDLNRNGMQDAGEAGIDGVTVNLRLQSDNSIIRTTTTGPNGFYQFTGLCAGNYKVEVVNPPADMLPTGSHVGSDITIDSNGSPALVSLPADDIEDLTIDFGYDHPPASLGDFVWEDLNRNGLQDVSEPGIDGVPVQLFACGGTTPLKSTVTTGGGAYLFDDLAAGCYEVGFDKPAGYVRTLANSGADDTDDSDADVATGRTGSYTLVSGEFNPTVDSGLYRPAALGDYVWLDSNGNGLQDVGETQSVVGAVATLYACGDSTSSLASQTIGASGLYLFNNLVPGSYMVKFTLPSGYTFTLPNAGGDDAKDSDANTTTGFSQCVTLLSGQTNLTVDAGAVIPTPPCVSSTLIFSGSSATSGTYGNIREFTYTGVKVRASAFSRYKTANTWETAYLGAYSLGLGVTDRSETGGNDSHTVDNSGRNNYVLLEFSAPVVVTRAFLDYVGADSDIQVWIGTFSNPFVNHLSLNDSVLGSFGLTEGSDTASADARWALFNGGAVVGNAVVIAARTDHTNDSFKLRKLQVCVPQTPKASLGDFVWDDQNANGIQDATEIGIDGATVKLLDAANNVLATRTTGDDPNTAGTQKGYYEFTGLTPGATYKVQFLMPAGFDSASPRKLGGDAAKDSDGLTSDPIVLAANEFNRTIDAGFHRTAPVCVSTTLTFAGTSATSRTKGNIRTYTFGTLSVKVSAFSRLKSSATWYTAYLGAYPYGLGVTDGAEGDGSADRHVVDNIDRNNYVLFEFSSPVTVDQAYLDYVRGDSDISVWFGNNPTGVNPFASHLTLSDTVVNAFSVKESNYTTSTLARWADINGGGAIGNALVIAAQVDQANDGFKLHKLLVCK